MKMPRYDDRLSNILALLGRDSSTSRNHVFRHVCDILVQEAATLDTVRILHHFASLYTSTDAAVRRDVLRVLAPLAQTIPEIIHVAALDPELQEEDLWARVQLSHDNWAAIVPNLSQQVLQALAQSADLPQATRDLISQSRQGQAGPTPSERAQQLNDALQVLQIETENSPPVPTVRAVKAEAEAPQTDDETVTAETSLQAMRAILDTVNDPFPGDDDAFELTQPADPEAVQDQNSTEDQDISDLQDTAQTPDSEPTHTLEAETLEASPAVEDQKIQDILERLRAFGRRYGTDNTDRPALPDIPPTVAEAKQPAETGQQSAGRARGAALFLPRDIETPAPEKAPARRVAGDARIFKPDAEPKTQPAPQPVSTHSLHDITWVTDRLGTIVEINAASSRAFGLKKAELIGAILTGVFVVDTSSRFVDNLNAKRAFRDIKMTARADQSHWSVSAIPVFDPKTDIFLGHRGTAQEIEIQGTVPAPALGGQPATSDTAQALDISSLAHELKTPLNAIRGFAEMIETEQLGPASPFARDRSGKIGRHADDLNHILSDLLFSTAHTAAGDTQPINLRSILDQILETYAQTVAISGRDALTDAVVVKMDEDVLTATLHKLLYIGALWTPATRAVQLTVTLNDNGLQLVTVLPIWRGGTTQHDLIKIEAGPALSLRHPLLSKGSKGRGLAASQDSLERFAASLTVHRAADSGAQLVISIPAKSA